MTEPFAPTLVEVGLGLSFCRKHNLARTRVAFAAQRPYADVMLFMAQEAGVELAIRHLAEDGHPLWIMAFAREVPNLTAANREALVAAMATVVHALKAPRACETFGDIMAHSDAAHAIEFFLSDVPGLDDAQRDRLKALLDLLPSW